MRLPTRSLLVVLSLSLPAVAQTATVRVSHDDPDGVIEPGQTINVRVDVTWQPSTLFAGLSGDALPTPTTGTSANITSIFQPGPNISLGTAALGGVVGFSVAAPVGAPPGQPGPFVAFDWTAPTDFQGPVTFAFAATATAPNVRLYASPGSPAFIEALTTFEPVTVSVVPAPAAVALTAMGCVWRGGRRRR